MREKEGITAGIDLGTTNSVLALLNDTGRPAASKNAEGEYITPSIVCFTPSGIIVGREALNAAVGYPDCIVREVKREMGKVDADGKPIVLFIDNESKEYNAPTISALILQKLKKDAEAATGQLISQAVITVPAYFNDAERQATINAGKIAGLDVLEVINEPTAAALRYGLTKKQDGLFAVYDLGGGTLDVSIIRIRNGNIEVIATDGCRNLGGCDWDLKIIGRILTEAKGHGINADIINSDPALAQDIKDRAVKIKHTLSTANEALFNAFIQGTLLKFTITRDEFDADCRDLVKKTEDIFRAALDSAGITASELTATILAGGATRMVMIKKSVEAIIGKPPRCDADPDLVVAEGAAMAAVQVAMEDGKKVLSLAGKEIKRLPGGTFKNVAAHALGCAAFTADGMEKVFVPIIRKNTPLPTVGTDKFALKEIGQTSAHVEVYQGQEGQSLEECLHIDDVILTDLPPGDNHEERIRVTYEYTRGAKVKVTALDEKSGKAAIGEISHQLGMTEAEIENAKQEIIDS